ncbi:MAG: phenylalanine--tRNA ligase subunit beta [Candidatus Aenigmarchaeota archaeon]|nr:phenylalanine--tRNA ligase subunit beta [Candidatus Aenigmarchaeota archaeon]
MPTITFDKKELLTLVGKKMKDEELENLINSLKPNVEKITENEVVIEFTSDRVDYFSIEGLARSIRSYLGLKNQELKIQKPKIVVTYESVPVRPYIACAVVRNLELTDSLIKSLMNLQEVIHENYGRKRKKVAIGLHDLEKIKGQIKYTGASREEKFVPLGEREEMSLIEVLAKTEKGKKYGHIISSANKWPVFVDEIGIFSFPPILNSDRTKVTEETKNIFIDITGTDKNAVNNVLNIFSLVFLERGATVEAVKIKGEREEITPKFLERAIEITKDDVKKFLGIDLDEESIKKLLEKMDYKVSLTKQKIIAIIKPYRVDVISKFDVLEDIAIAFGYENFEPELPNVFTQGEVHKIEKISDEVREVLVGYGFQEVVRPILTNQKLQFEKMNLKNGETIKILNPVSELYTELRVWLLPGLLDFLAKNTRESYPQKVFEIGDVVLKDETKETNSINIRKVAGVVADNTSFFSGVKRIVLEVSKIFKKEVSFEEMSHPSFIEGRAAKVVLNGKEIGFIGEINPLVLENFKIYMPVSTFELSLEDF